ncbi:MAG: LysE family translocator [Odoribacter splanchnicus]|nr:LysE family translocator [Odoribacter splanchnicus]
MNIWGFISTAVLLTLMPGPDILFVITQSITRGCRAGIVFAAGLCTGLVAHVTAVSLGVSLLLLNSPVAFTVLKVAGASYLIYLSVKAFIGRKRQIQLELAAGTGGKLYRKGILMNVLNPKVILFFLAFFPQFIEPGIANPIPQMLILGGIFMVQAFLVFSTVAFLAERLARRLMSKPRFSFVMNLVEALVYFVVGISILFV